MQITPLSNRKGTKTQSVGPFLVPLCLCGSLILLLVALRRPLLVVFLALKILGHSAALDAWKGAVSHQTVVNSGIPVDIYGDPRSLSAMLIVHGVNPTGKD